MRTRDQILLIWLCLVVVSLAGLNSFGLPDLLVGPDDDMRQLRVDAFLEGQGWYDDRVSRIDPPAGAVLHWSRLADLPLSVVNLLTGLAVAAQTASVVSVVAVPLLLGLAYLLSLSWAAKPLLGPACLAAPALAAITTVGIKNFWPGRIDHHAWMMLASVLCLGACLRLVRTRAASRRACTFAGVATVIALAITAETTALFATVMLIFTLAWITDGADIISPIRAYATASALAGLCLLPIEQAPANLGQVACDAFALPYVTALVVAACFWWTVPTLAVRCGWRGRLGWGAIGGIGVISALLALFPECRTGPMAQVPSEQWEIWLNDAGGMQSLVEKSYTVRTLILVPALFAVLGVGLAMREQMIDVRSAAVLLTWLLVWSLLAILSTRQYIGLHTAVPLGLGLLLVQFWQRVEKLRGRWLKLFTGNFLTLAVLVAPLAAVVLEKNAPAANDARQADCPGIAIGEAFAARPDLPPGRVAAPIFAGPDILIRSPHSVIGAQYHRNVLGNLKVHRLLSATDAQIARDLVREAGADYIAICRDGRIDATTFQHDLANGTPPPWLHDITPSTASHAKLYRVK